MKQLFTSESVSEAHPDKLADQISDAILDEAFRLAGNKYAQVRSACETLVKGNLLVIAGEMENPKEVPNYKAIAKQVAIDVGYNDVNLGFDPNECVIVESVNNQSLGIAMGVDKKEQGAGDQGMMFGYACDETKELMPLALTISHELMKRQASLRKNKTHPWLRPDAKAQVTIEYKKDKPHAINTIVLSTQHVDYLKKKKLTLNEIRKLVKKEIIDPVTSRYKNIVNDKFICHINPTGEFVTGGPEADAGLTGRKIIVDTYGGAAPHGGGAFSGKDPSKVDRSAAYAARYIAKQIVASKLAKKALVQISYAIGVAKPVSIMVDTFSTAKINDELIADKVKASFELTPKWIINHLGLIDPKRRPIYRKTASFGHFGRSDLKLPWEKVDTTSEFYKWCNKKI